MTFLDEAARQMTGAWKMAFGRDDWEDVFDRSAKGVFGSFRAVLIVVPLTILATFTATHAARRVSDLSTSIYAVASPAVLIPMDLTTLAVDWAASLALLVGAARATGATRNAGAMIAGYNWMLPVMTAAQLPPLALMAATGGAAWGGLVGMLTLALSIALIWGIIRRGLGAAPAPTIAVMAMLFALGVAADQLVTGFARAILPAQS